VDHIDEFTIQLRNSISGFFECLESDPGKQYEITKAYMGRLFGLNQTRRFIYDGKLSDGTIKGVDENGQLIMEIEGARIVLGPKEVRFVFN
jgi:biotin-(acetyl-CoA carboxylase) ligase